MHSPLPIKQTTMDFGDAMREVVNKKRIHKLEWNDMDYYGFLDGGRLRLHRPDGTITEWNVSEGDLNGDDFITI